MRDFKIKDAAEEAVIEIYGDIGRDWWTNEGITLKSIAAKISAIKAPSIRLKINSLGGDVNDAFAILDLLRASGKAITSEMTGLCASAATIIAMAGTTRTMNDHSLFLIHRSSTAVYGNLNEMQAGTDELKKIDDAIINVYTCVTKRKREDIEKLMDENNGNGKWIAADEALEYGFITEIVKLPQTGNSMSADADAIIKSITFHAVPQAAVSPLERLVSNVAEKFTKKPKNQQVMDKYNIKDFVFLAAALGIAELEQTDKGVTITTDQLKAINDSMQKADEAAKSATAKNDENAKKLAENAKAIDDSAKSIKDLQEKIEQLSAPKPNVNGTDAHVRTYADEMRENPLYKEAAELTGKTL